MNRELPHGVPRVKEFSTGPRTQHAWEFLTIVNKQRKKLE